MYFFGNALQRVINIKSDLEIKNRVRHFFGEISFLYQLVRNLIHLHKLLNCANKLFNIVIINSCCRSLGSERFT